MEQIKTGNPNYIIYKQINNNFKELDKNKIEQVNINKTPLPIKNNTVNIPLDDYLADLFKNASFDVNSSVLSFTKYNNSKLNIKLPLGLKQVELSSDYNLIFTQSDNSTLTVNLGVLKDIYNGDNSTIEVYIENGINKIRVKDGVFTKLNLFNQTVTNLNTQINKSIQDIKNLQDTKVDKVYDDEGNEDKVVLTSALNTTLTAYATLVKLNEEIAKVTAIAQGKSQARVFDTKADLDAWLLIPENVAILQVGDDFLIKEEDSPDYWWDGSTIVPYESKMPDITNMVTTDTDQTITGQKDFTNRPTVNNKTVALQEDIKGNVFTDADKQKLQGIEVGAQVNKVNSVAGKTGDIVLSKEDIGLNNVDNTSDLDKPISTAQQGAFDRKVDKEEGKGLSTNDFTEEEKNKLAGLENYNDSEIREELNNIIESIPTQLSDLEEDSSHRTVTDYEKQTWNNKLSSYTETDPTVPSWAKQQTKPEYSYNEIKNTPTIPTKTSQLTNDSNFATKSEIPTNNNQLTNGAGYITSTQASSTYATKTELSSKANQSDLTAEINKRTSADSNLQSQIDDLESKIDPSFHSTLFRVISSYMGDHLTKGSITLYGATKSSEAYIEFLPKDGGAGKQIRFMSNGKIYIQNIDSSTISTDRLDILGKEVSYIQEQTDTYVKWSDGRMEQHFTVTTSAGKVTSHTFPVAFTSTPIVHRNIIKDGTGNANQLRGWNVSALTSTGFQLYTPDISGANTSMISAYGKWK